MKKILLGSVVLLSCLANPTVAGPNWNQISLSVLLPDYIDEDISGLGVSGTALINPSFFIAGSYSALTKEETYNIDQNLNSFSLGVGARTAVANNTDIFSVVSYEYIENELRSGWYDLSLDDWSGYGVRAGFRTLMTPKLELGIVLSQVKIDDVTVKGGKVAAAYHFTNQFAVGAGYGTAEDVDTFSLSGIMTF